MSFAKVFSAQTSFLSTNIITIEVDLARGLHAFSIVGLPDKAVEESRDRISAAIKNSGFTSPKEKNQKTVISLAPANLKKEGPVFDLGMALAYLLASKDIRFDSEGKLFVGELSLDGETRPVRGILPIVQHAKAKKFKEVYVPSENAEEAALIEGIDVYPVSTLAEVIQHLNIRGKLSTQKSIRVIEKQPRTRVVHRRPAYAIDIGDVRGQETAKRGLLIAAAGGHNIALYGPPGTGKTMLARAFVSILPPLPFEEALEVTGIHSIAGTLDTPLLTTAPFRSPHHTSSYVSVVGGGASLRPGEVTLAHNGVLFLDEFPEFDRRVMESLREPLEDRAITVARAKGTAKFPARFILIAALNPCPCGNFGGKKECICSPMQLERYRKKVSGPIIDRIDMWIEVANIGHDKLSGKGCEESKSLAALVHKARAQQAKRFKKVKNKSLNSDMSVKEIDALIEISLDVRKVLNQAAAQYNLSPRAYHRVIKLARTIADLAESTTIESNHMLEALQYRPRSWIT